MKALAVHSITLQVGTFSETIPVKPKDQQIVFEVPLKQGDTEVRGTMANAQGKTIAGAYYIYVTRLRP